MTNLMLEDRLKKIFRDNDEPEAENPKKQLKQDATKALLDEKYEEAYSMFSQLAAFETNNSLARVKHLRKMVECKKELFKLFPNDKDFQDLCTVYNMRLKEDYSADAYLDYIYFLNYELATFPEPMDFREEALAIAKKGSHEFPECSEIFVELHNLYNDFGMFEMGNEAMMHACKLCYDNPEYLFRSFSTELFEPSQEEKEMPLIQLLKYRNQEIMKDPWLLERYSDEISETGIQPLIAFNLYQRIYKMNMAARPRLKEKIKEAYEDAKMITDDPNELFAIEKAMVRFTLQNKLDHDKEWVKFCNANLGQGLEEAEGKRPVKKDALAIKKQENVGNNFSSEITLPKDFKKSLDDYVIGQEMAKQAISVAFYQHTLRINGSAPGVEKSNILILGPTGNGKTYIAETAAKLLKLPFVIGDATKITDSGYVGADAEDLLLSLFLKSGKDKATTEKGIIYIDEADKIRANPGSGKDVGGEGAQQQLLKLIEGSDVEVPLNKKTGESIRIDTRNILFIVGGAFSDTMMGEDLYSRVDESTIGFNTASEDTKKYSKVMRKLTDKDLHNYGFLPEFAGRLHHRIILDKLEREDMRDILVKPKNAVLTQYKKVFKASGIKLEVTEGALDYIAEKAAESNSGARSLRSIFEQIVYKPLFELPGTEQKTFTIDENYLEKELSKADF